LWDAIAIGTPSVLDENGLVKIIELNLDGAEQADFKRSADMVSADIKHLT
jgi:malate dehydrogenase